MSHHDTQVKRSGEGVVGTCSCRQRQVKPVMNRQEAEDWCRWHLDQVARAQADPGKHLTGTHYLAYLQERASDPDVPPRDRRLFAQLADEQERRMRAPTPKGVPGLPASANRAYNTGVDTEPLF